MVVLRKRKNTDLRASVVWVVVSQPPRSFSGSEGAVTVHGGSTVPRRWVPGQVWDGSVRYWCVGLAQGLLLESKSLKSQWVVDPSLSPRLPTTRTYTHGHTRTNTWSCSLVSPSRPTSHSWEVVEHLFSAFTSTESQNTYGLISFLIF